MTSKILVPPQRSYKVDATLDQFVNDTEVFIESYFGKGETIKNGTIDFDQVLEDLRFMLKRVKRGLPPR